MLCGVCKNAVLVFFNICSLLIVMSASAVFFSELTSHWLLNCWYACWKLKALFHFEVFQPVWSAYLIDIDRQTDGRTDGQTTCRGVTGYCVAPRGKKTVFTVFCGPKCMLTDDNATDEMDEWLQQWVTVWSSLATPTTYTTIDRTHSIWSFLIIHHRHSFLLGKCLTLTCSVMFSFRKALCQSSSVNGILMMSNIWSYPRSNVATLNWSLKYQDSKGNIWKSAN